MSTPLKDGIYALHYVPPGAKLPFAGGVYATGDQPNHPVLAQAHNPAVVKGFQKVIIARSLCVVHELVAYLAFIYSGTSNLH